MLVLVALMENHIHHTLRQVEGKLSPLPFYTAQLKAVLLNNLSWLKYLFFALWLIQ